MIGLPKLKSCGQSDLGDDGTRTWDEQIGDYIDRNYPGWQNPVHTSMVPPEFSYRTRNPDEGQRTEKDFFELVQKFGESRKEGMFVFHSPRFKERDSEWNEYLTKTESNWLIGEHDFVIIHRQLGIVFFQVKAASKTRGKFGLANQQLDKDQQSLHAFAVEYLQGKLKRDVDKEVYLYPGFVVMPNCPRPTSPQFQYKNGIFKEDCETVEAFSKWWEKNIKRKMTIDQEVFDCLVMRFIGMLQTVCLNQSIDKSHKVLAFLTNEQLKVMLDSTSEQWVTGPAGSGKTWLLIEKVKLLAQKAILHNTKEKILVVCYNLPLFKMLSNTFEAHSSRLLQDDEDQNSNPVVDVKTFGMLITEITEERGEANETEVSRALRVLERDVPRRIQQYDHIFVDECQDLIGNWPMIFHRLWKEEGDDDDYSDSNHKWFFYDTNQHLRFSQQRRQLYEKNLRGSTKLTRVLRNTGNVFNQSVKYFQSVLRTAIKLGHQEYGLPIKWDKSLPNTQVTASEGAKSVVQHIRDLRRNKVQDKDICVLVETTEVGRRLSSELKRLGVDNQNAEQLHEESVNKVVVESIRRFKGLESKVVLLYNPRFFIDKDWTTTKVKEVLYTAVSRCFCYLVVITTEKGYEALQSVNGIREGTLVEIKPSSSPMLQTPHDLESEKRSQLSALYKECFGKRNIDTQYDSGPPESTSKRGIEEDDESEDESKYLVKVSRIEEAKYTQHQKRIQKLNEAKPRAKKVDGSSLLEPGDTFIEDKIRNNVFSLLNEPVRQNLQYLPSSSSNSRDHSSLDVEGVITQIEYTVYCSFRNDTNSKRYTGDLRSLKQKIEAFNKRQEIHESVKTALEKYLQGQ